MHAWLDGIGLSKRWLRPGLRARRLGAAGLRAEGAPRTPDEAERGVKAAGIVEPAGRVSDAEVAGRAEPRTGCRTSCLMKWMRPPGLLVWCVLLWSLVLESFAP